MWNLHKMSNKAQGKVAYKEQGPGALLLLIFIYLFFQIF